MTVDEAALKADFEQKRHLEVEPGVTPIRPDEIRTPKEYVTFKQIEAVWKRREPKKDGETDAQWMNRVRQGALQELKASRAASSPARMWLLDRLNFSPVAKAGRIFSKDNLLGDLPLQVAGDYGWMIRANEFGYKTPPSLLVRAMRHNVAHNEIRQALDAHWLKYAQRNSQATGTSFMGQNITAAAEAMKASVKSAMGQKVLTKRQFSEMAGRAVFDKDSFAIDGIEVVPEAREVAKVWTRVAQKYDKEARELGIFYDQTSLRRTMQVADEKISDMRARMAEWLWGETGEPEALTPAIRVKVTVNDFEHADAGIYKGFHGSTKGFTKFDKSKLGEFTGAQSAREGFFFSRKPETANTYTEAEKLATKEQTTPIEPEAFAAAKNVLSRMNATFAQVYDNVDEILRAEGVVFEDFFDNDRWSISELVTDEELEVGRPDADPVMLAAAERQRVIKDKVRDQIEAFNDIGFNLHKEYLAATGGQDVPLESLKINFDTEATINTAQGIKNDFTAEAKDLAARIDEMLAPHGTRFANHFGIETDMDLRIWRESEDEVSEFLTDSEYEDAFGPGSLERRKQELAAVREAEELVRAFRDKWEPEKLLWSQLDDKISDMMQADALKNMGIDPDDVEEDGSWAPTGASVHPVKLVMRNPYVYDQRGESYRERKFTEIVKTAKAEGHDSVIIKNTFDTWGSGFGDVKDDIYVVFEEDQIVSVFDAPRVAETERMGEREVEQVFTGKTHEEAIERLLMMNPNADVSAAARGFTTKASVKDIPEPEDPRLDHDPGSGTYHMGDQEITRDEYMAEMVDYQQRLDEWRAAMRSQPEQAMRKFRTADQVMQGRIESLSEGQRYVYDDMLDQMDRLTRAREEANAQLAVMKDTPHRFMDQFGEPEPFFARFWNHTKIGGEDRARFERLLYHWYRKDNPVGAKERATQTVDDMLKHGDGEDERASTVPGLQHLHKRTLDLPNSFRVNDPELGEISAAEFFNTDIEVVSEAYTRGMGHKIEAARMFGDAGLWQKMEDMEDHWREQYLRPALKKGASRSEMEKLRAQWDEYAGWMTLIRQGILGGLKTKDPWSMGNRWARNLKNYQIITSMGRILLTSIPEMMRIPMVNGFRDTFSGLWLRAFADMDTIKGNLELSRESGEIFDLVRDVHHARIAELNQPDPSGGGTYIEKLLERAVPGFLKLVGQTHFTVMAKDAVMFTAQHKVMKLALDLDAGDNAAKLAALGISRRDARLLSQMPFERHGRVILPSVDKWRGADGRRARTLLLDAIHGEARRAIVTPSFADKSLIFQGILARKGQVKWESDLMTVPLQFMSYGIAAHNKVLMSGLQGRDQNFYMGAFSMFLAGVMSNYLKQPQTATMNKSPEEWLIEGYEASGVGGFWFADLNQMIERYSYNTVGIRPQIGADPRFGRTTDVGDLVDIGGPSLGTIADVGRAFFDPEQSMTNRAQAIRRAVPYNNVLWWGFITRDMATAAGRSMEE
jgi:hypothetical protein